jgi:UDP-N-acetylmuramate dehydrogenase
LVAKGSRADSSLGVVSKESYASVDTAALFFASGLECIQAAPLSPLVTACTGGSAQFYLEVNSHAELAKALRLLDAIGLEFRILGNGSNVLISDEGVSGCVIKLGRGFRFVDKEDQGCFVVGASMPLMTLARQCASDGWSGLEFAGGIPASLGGAITMNAGAHGGDCAGVVDSVQVVSEVSNWEPEWVAARELAFSYRHSSISARSVVTAARLILTKSSAGVCAENLAKNLAYRKLSQPLQFPSFGSVFKNPHLCAIAKDRFSKRNLYYGKSNVDGASPSAAWLIESVSLKGYQIGGAMFSELHANWIVNKHRNATTAEILALIELAKTRVFKHYEIELQEEVHVWGGFNDRNE